MGGVYHILYSCTLSEEVWGVYTKLPITKYVVYGQPIDELIGMVSKHTTIKSENTVYIEVGHLFQMLADNHLLAYELISCPPEYLDLQDTYNLKGLFKDCLNTALIKGLLEESRKNIKIINEKLADFETTAYFCAKQAALAEGLLLSGEYKYLHINQLQSIYDCRLHEKAVLAEVRKIYKSINKHLKTTLFQEYPDKGLLNNKLINIRHGYTAGWRNDVRDNKEIYLSA